uniref:Uncharacterized protein n=1 Tax=Anguilla anguilla TaxID=7936 RepID=A0A0E9V1T5_ANGAN
MLLSSIISKSGGQTQKTVVFYC